MTASPKTTRKRVRPAPSVAPRLTRRGQEIVSLLKHHKLTLATAESCTGGLIAATLSQAEGASDVLEGAYVTYTKAQKTRALGVPSGLLRHTSAVTADIARRMANGALKRAKTRMALSMTGVLGPMPDDDGNPVGLIYVCCVRGKLLEVEELRLPRMSHDRMRLTSVLAAFDLIAKLARKSKR